jgi:hypothetical protein
MLTTQLATARLEDELRRAQHDLESVLRLLKAAVRRMDDAEPGYPGGSHGGGTGDDSGPLRSAVVMADDAIRDRAELAKLAQRTALDARNLLGICHRWGIARHGDGTTREPDEMWCRSCLRAGHMTPKRQANHGPNCRWCGDALRTVNGLRAERRQPALTELPIEAVRWHAEGRKITDKVLDQWARGQRR